MKTVFITFNQAFQYAIVQILDRNSLRGYTYWETVQGRGSKTGEPHYGSHAWPTLNGAIMTVIDAEKVDRLLEQLHELDTKTEALGLRAFVWNVEKAI